MRKITYLIAVLIAFMMMSCGGQAPSSKSPDPYAGTKGYILNFGTNFKTGMNSVDDFGISVVIAVDVSGSMGDSPRSGGEPKYKQAAKALVTVASYLENMTKQQKDLKIQVAILKFSSGVKTVLPITVLDAEGLTKLKTAIDPNNFIPDGGTTIGYAIENGSEILAQSGTILNSLIVITDGESNGGPDPEDVMTAVYSDRNSATTMDVKVHTSSQLISFIGFDVNSPQFDSFHSLGARVMSADNQSELESSLKSLLEADITKLESK